MSARYLRPVKVTVSDPITGEVLGEQVLNHDYVLITAGRRYLKSSQVMGRMHILRVGYDANTFLTSNDEAGWAAGKDGAS